AGTARFPLAAPAAGGDTAIRRGSRCTPPRGRQEKSMPKWFDLDPVDDTFFETAGHRFVYPMRLRAGPEEVWAGLTAPRPLQWVSLLDAEFTSAQPYGEGTTRRVTVGPGLLRMREHFFVWKDAERRHAFYAEQATVPLFRAFA